jgi:hypothetical protein
VCLLHLIKRKLVGREVKGVGVMKDGEKEKKERKGFSFFSKEKMDSRCRKRKSSLSPDVSLTSVVIRRLHPT